jgi:copper chaperone
MIELKVPDMTCGHCAATITRAVKEVDAAGSVEVDLAAHRVRIASTHPAAAFVSAIADAGYTPTVVPAH